MKSLAEVIRHPDLPSHLRADLHQLYLGMNAATMPTMAECRAAFNRLKSTNEAALEIQSTTRTLLHQFETGSLTPDATLQHYLKKVETFITEDTLPELRARLG